MSIGPQQLPPKKDVALALLEESSVFVHLDPRRTGVIVPPRFHKQPELVLQIGLNMAVQIPDLKVDDDGISCTLSFSRTPFWCCLPWTAIYALLDERHQGMIWPDDVPPEIMTDMLQRLAPMIRAARRPRPKLSLVDGPPESEAQVAAETRASEQAAAGGASEAEKVEKERPADETEAKPPVLQAVPVPAPEPPAEAKKEPVERPDAAKAETESMQGSKRKREIPPWLRVIK